MSSGEMLSWYKKMVIWYMCSRILRTHHEQVQCLTPAPTQKNNISLDINRFLDLNSGSLQTFGHQPSQKVGVSIRWEIFLHLPSCKSIYSNEISPSSIGNTSSKGPFSIAMLLYRSVSPSFFQSLFLLDSVRCLPPNKWATNAYLSHGETPFRVIVISLFGQEDANNKNPLY